MPRGLFTLERGPQFQCSGALKALLTTTSSSSTFSSGPSHHPNEVTCIILSARPRDIHCQFKWPT
eukprot:439449-Amphidinium_carterae.1